MHIIVKILSILNGRFSYPRSSIRGAFIVLLFFSPGSIAFSQENGRTLYVALANGQSFGRENEVVEIPVKEFGVIPVGYVPVAKTRNHLLNSQWIDAGKDGRDDKLLLEVSLAPFSKDTAVIVWVPKQEATFKQCTNVRFSLKTSTSQPSPEIESLLRARGFVQDIANPTFQMEGPGIENDKVAFRCFFDYRNGKDIYGKLIPQPVLDSVGLQGSWHTMQSWGMDILRTGNSLGAGALAVEERGKLFRLADADSSFFKFLYEGPLRAAFRLDFHNWDVANDKKEGSECIRITKGDFFYQNHIRLDLDARQQQVVGIANFEGLAPVYTKHNATYSSISIYGAQAEGTHAQLGLAILFSGKDYVHNGQTAASDDIPNTAYVVLKNGMPERDVYFFACWEKTDSRFASYKGFQEYVQNAADRLANPIKVKIISKKQ